MSTGRTPYTWHLVPGRPFQGIRPQDLERLLEMSIRPYTPDDLNGLVSICMDTWIVPEVHMHGHLDRPRGVWGRVA